MTIELNLQRLKKLEEIFEEGIAEAKKNNCADILALWAKTIGKMIISNKNNQSLLQKWECLGSLNKIAVTEGGWFSLTEFKAAIKRGSI